MMKSRLKKGKNFASNTSENFLTEDTESNHVNKKWFEDIADDPKKFPVVTQQVVIELKDEAKRCNDAEVSNYNIKNSKSNSNYKWMRTVLSKGTVSDKIAASTVIIQDNPICSLNVLQNLVNMVRVGKKRECIMVIDTLTELFLSDLLRPNQKLKAFHTRPLSLLNDLSGDAIRRRKLLSIWYFEDQLKELFKNFVLALNNVAHDVIDSNKEKAIGSMFKLLVGNPEQEKNLLSYLVNKLGDPSQKVASKVIYCLGQLLLKHSNMQGVVLNEVEKLLFRANVSSKAQYYGLCFLSQFYLSHDSSDIARKLIAVYFSFFKAFVKKGEVDSRMMSALLMGVNRAYPYAKLQMDKISDHIDTMYRIVHIASFNIGLHALSLLYQVSDHENNVSDRFYSALYRKLLDPKLLTTTHQAMLLSLIYKAILKDVEVIRVKVFIKRLLQLTLFIQPSFGCGILYTVSQLMGKKNGIQSLVLKQSLTEDDDDEKYHDVDTEVKEIKHEKTSSDAEEEDVKPDTGSAARSSCRPSWDHSANSENKSRPFYRPLSRNPLYAGGEFCAYTELLNLKNHFHPTVALYARNLMEGDIIKYSGDPLKDFTLVRFLDRFVFKNPKKCEEGFAQGAHPTFGKRKHYNPKGLKAVPVNSRGYLNEHIKNIPVDELFMYSYLQKKYKDKKERTDTEDEESDLESVQSEEFEEMLNKMASSSSEKNDLDFLNDIGDNLKQNNNKRKRKVNDDEENIDSEDDENSSDKDAMSIDDQEDNDDLNSEDSIEANEEDKELWEGLDDEDENEEIVFEDEEEPKKRRKKSKSKDSVFAAAEEFASLLDDESGSQMASGTSSAYANKDNASLKQIAWEDKRNRWLKGFNKMVGGKKTKNTGDFGTKRRHRGKFSNKAKKSKT